jgi:OMF family outer membrane factor
VRIQTTEGLSLQQAVDLAVQQNPQIQQADLGVQRAEADLDQAYADYQPTVSSQADYNYIQSPDLGSPFSSDSSVVSATLLRLDYTVFDAGNRESTVQIAKQGLSIAQLQQAQTSQTLKFDVAEAYYLLQNADALVAINQGAVENSQASLRDAQAREKAGLGTRFDVLQAQTELANNQQDLLRSQNDQRLAQRRLAELLNFASPTNVTATDPILPAGEWDVSLEDSIVAAYQAREELEIQRRNLELAKARARNALSINGPELSVFASYDVAENLQAEDDFDDGYSVGANVSVRLYDGGAAQSQAKAFEIDAQTAASQFDQTRNSIRRAVEDAFLSLNSNREQIDSSKVAIASAEESLRLARLRFQAGVGTQTDVITAEAALTTARGNLSTAIIGYNRSLVALKRAVSGL